MIVLQFVLLLPALISARKYSEQERLYRLPQLLHLDDYHRCLSRQDGLYCYGTFELTPTKLPNPAYEYMKEYSSDIANHYNRTRIHRGYCVSERCPTRSSDASLQGEHNASVRFENCVPNWTRKLSLQTKLSSLQYCRTHADTIKPHVPDTSELIFLYIVIGIILLNIVGTIYASFHKDESKKSNLLATWSIPTNWRRLFNDTEGEDSRLNDLLPTHGAKAVPVLLAIFVHIALGHMYLLAHEAHNQEDKLDTALRLFMANSAGIIHTLACLAAFLTSYNLLLLSEKVRLSVKLLPLCFLKRITRLAPVYFLTSGFAATWWVHVRDGPLWIKVANEHTICRRKFWTHVLFVSNIVEPEKWCIPTTWSLVADVQLSIICCVLTLTMARLRRRALPILAAMTLTTCIINSVRGYIYEWVPLREFGTPESAHNLSTDVPSFYDFYVTFWSNLPCSLIGVFLAHLHYELQRENFNAAKHKWLVISTTLAVPGLICFIIMLSKVDGDLSRLVAALFIGFENPALCVFLAYAYLGGIHIKGFTYKVFSWRMFQILSRLILSVVTISWLVHITIAASRPHPNFSTWTDLLVDYVATCILTVLIAIPVTILVEIPMRRFLDTLIFSSYIKKYASKKAKEKLQDNSEVGFKSKDEDTKKKVL